MILSLHLSKTATMREALRGLRLTDEAKGQAVLAHQPAAQKGAQR
ncbi:hypothetical protein Q9295_07540 [Xinfangfangia sp. CPCC 101601]|uniref:Uncharacterized protein n=1 Tax=Pseudogemmobacter lacusdianii TaxID=3069608 RepID=A0ABU0VYF2_9RHOB|nr:hypothetical protein [Xinfangfangia sp. CPCC 101601]MDQ2066220.1 hypothetical protein [Xinfangfangia sp. CPCC 101601]